MTYSQLQNQILVIKTNAEKQVNILEKEYAREYSQYGKGDIVEDYYHIIKIDHISRVYKEKGIPKVVYEGVELCKNLVPRKIQKDTHIYEGSIVRLIKKG